MSSDDADLSTFQEAFAYLVGAGGGFLSVLGAGCLLYVIGSSDELFRNVKYRFIFVHSVFNLLIGLYAVTGDFFVPRLDENNRTTQAVDVWLNYGSTATCNMGGIVQQWGVAGSVLSGAAVMAYYLLTMVHGMPDEQVEQVLELSSHAGTLFFPLITAIASAPLDVLGPSPVGCYYATKPFGCLRYDDDPQLVQSCSTGNRAYLCFWLFAGIPLLLVMMFATYALWRLRRYFHYLVSFGAAQVLEWNETDEQQEQQLQLQQQQSAPLPSPPSSTMLDYVRESLTNSAVAPCADMFQNEESPSSSPPPQHSRPQSPQTAISPHAASSSPNFSKQDMRHASVQRFIEAERVLLREVQQFFAVLIVTNATVIISVTMDQVSAEQAYAVRFLHRLLWPLKGLLCFFIFMKFRFDAIREDDPSGGYFWGWYDAVFYFDTIVVPTDYHLDPLSKHLLVNEDNTTTHKDGEDNPQQEILPLTRPGPVATAYRSVSAPELPSGTTPVVVDNAFFRQRIAQRRNSFIHVRSSSNSNLQPEAGVRIFQQRWSRKERSSASSVSWWSSPAHRHSSWAGLEYSGSLVELAPPPRLGRPANATTPTTTEETPIETPSSQSNSSVLLAKARSLQGRPEEAQTTKASAEKTVTPAATALSQPSSSIDEEEENDNTTTTTGTTSSEHVVRQRPRDAGWSPRDSDVAFAQPINLLGSESSLLLSSESSLPEVSKGPLAPPDNNDSWAIRDSMTAFTKEANLLLQSLQMEESSNLLEEDDPESDSNDDVGDIPVQRPPPFSIHNRKGSNFDSVLESVAEELEQNEREFRPAGDEMLIGGTAGTGKPAINSSPKQLNRLSSVVESEESSTFSVSDAESKGVARSLDREDSMSLSERDSDHGAPGNFRFTRTDSVTGTEELGTSWGILGFSNHTTASPSNLIPPSKREAAPKSSPPTPGSSPQTARLKRDDSTAEGSMSLFDGDSAHKAGSRGSTSTHGDLGTSWAMLTTSNHTTLATSNHAKPAPVARDWGSSGAKLGISNHAPGRPEQTGDGAEMGGIAVGQINQESEHSNPGGQSSTEYDSEFDDDTLSLSENISLHKPRGNSFFTRTDSVTRLNELGPSWSLKGTSNHSAYKPSGSLLQPLKQAKDDTTKSGAPRTDVASSLSGNNSDFEEGSISLSAVFQQQKPKVEPTTAGGAGTGTAKMTNDAGTSWSMLGFSNHGPVKSSLPLVQFPKQLGGPPVSVALRADVSSVSENYSEFDEESITLSESQHRTMRGNAMLGFADSVSKMTESGTSLSMAGDSNHGQTKNVVSPAQQPNQDTASPPRAVEMGTDSTPMPENGLEYDVDESINLAETSEPPPKGGGTDTATTTTTTTKVMNDMGTSWAMLGVSNHVPLKSPAVQVRKQASPGDLPKSVSLRVDGRSVSETNSELDDESISLSESAKPQSGNASRGNDSSSKMTDMGNSWAFLGTSIHSSFGSSPSPTPLHKSFGGRPKVSKMDVPGNAYLGKNRDNDDDSLSLSEQHVGLGRQLMSSNESLGSTGMRANSTESLTKNVELNSSWSFLDFSSHTNHQRYTAETLPPALLRRDSSSEKSAGSLESNVPFPKYMRRHSAGAGPMRPRSGAQARMMRRNSAESPYDRSVMMVGGTGRSLEDLAPANFIIREQTDEIEEKDGAYMSNELLGDSFACDSTEFSLPSRYTGATTRRMSNDSKEPDDLFHS